MDRADLELPRTTPTEWRHDDPDRHGEWPVRIRDISAANPNRSPSIPRKENTISVSTFSQSRCTTMKFETSCVARPRPTCTRTYVIKMADRPWRAVTVYSLPVHGMPRNGRLGAFYL